MAGKKKRARSPESIAKQRETIAKRKAAQQRAGKKKTRRVPARQPAAAPIPLVDIGERFVELLADALQHTIAVIVREEIRKVLQGGLS